MEAPLLGCAICLLAFSTLSSFSLAQSRGGSTGARPTTGNVGNTAPTPPGAQTPLSNPTVFLSGKVALDDGGQLTEPVAIQTICRGQRQTQAYSDRHGNFSFQFGDPSSSSNVDFADASNSFATRTQTLQQQRNWQECEVQAVLAGFSSEVIELTSRMSTLESTDIGRVVLHRLAHVEGTSISVTSALAPNDARKAYEKARDQEKKEKWDQALESLQKAVNLYPKYAVAWFELGRLQLMKNDSANAKSSFEQSLAADAKYVNPYNGLAELAFMANQWKQVIEITNKLLALNPVNFPGAYFFNSAANYYLQDINASEKSARQGIKVDEGHQVPKLQYLLAMVLVHKQEYAEAAEHMQAFLKMATQATDIDAAKKQLNEIARLAATPSSASATTTK